MYVQIRKPYQSPAWSYEKTHPTDIAPVGDRTHDLPHTVVSNMVKVSHALNHSATAAVYVHPKALLQDGSHLMPHDASADTTYRYVIELR